jgi:hypothetical protein
LLENPKRLVDVADLFSPSSFLPAIEDLEEGLTIKQLRERFGNVESEKFKKAHGDIKTRILSQDIFRSWSAEKKKPAADSK